MISVHCYLEIIVYPSNANISQNVDSKNQMELLASDLANGYEILLAIPWSTRDSAGIKYILKKVTP